MNTITLLGILRTAALVAVLGYVVVVGLLYLFQRSLIYPTWALAAEAAVRLPPPGLERVAVATTDGQRLAALWKPPRDGAPVIVSFHGNAATPHPYADRFANEAPWAGGGYGVLVVAYRGYPGSTGRPSEAGLIEDARAALAFVAGRAPGAPLVLHGHSLGAAVAVAAALEAEADLLYLEAPFHSALRMAREGYPAVPAGLLLKDTFRNDLRLPDARARDVLIAHGELDRIVPVAHGADLAAERVGTRFVRVPGADHVSILGVADQEAARLVRERRGDPQGAE